MLQGLSRVALIAVLAVFTSACGLVLRNTTVSDLQANPGRYSGRSINIDGVVTTAWGVPFVPFRFYKVNDGSGEVTVLSQGTRTPTRGARVRVRGTVNELAVIGGRPLGLHLHEEKLNVRR